MATEHYIFHVDIHTDLANLQKMEADLDKCVMSYNQELLALTRESQNARLAYVTHGDIQGLDFLKDQIALAVKAPPETTFDPNKVSGGSIKIALNLQNFFLYVS